ncbi:MAG: Trm112 family protein [Gammaproteobacteria bacterium]
MNRKMLELLACPRCHRRLEYRHKQKLLICSHDRLAFPVREGIPVLLESDAQLIDAHEMAGKESFKN